MVGVELTTLEEFAAATLYLAWALLRLPIPPLPTATGDVVDDPPSFSDRARRAVPWACTVDGGGIDDECDWDILARPPPPPPPLPMVDIDVAVADDDPIDIADDLRLACRKRFVMALATTFRRALTVRPSM